MTHKQRVLQLLKDGNPHSHHELYGLGCVAHSRISDLRRDGHRIRAWREGDVYLYALDEAPADAEPSLPGGPLPGCEAGASSSAPASDSAAREGVGVLTLFAPGPATTW